MKPHIAHKRTIFAFIDGRLGRWRRARLEAHMRSCNVCLEYYNHIVSLKSSIARSCPPTPHDWTALDRGITRAIASLPRNPRTARARRLAPMAAAAALLATSTALAVRLFSEVGADSSPETPLPAVGSNDDPTPAARVTTHAAPADAGPGTEPPVTQTPRDTAPLQPAADAEDGPGTKSPPTSPAARRTGRERAERRVKRWPGQLPKTVIEETLQRAMPSIRDCYEHHLKRDPGLILLLEIALSVSPSGAVYAVALSGDAPPRAMGRCVEGRLQKIRFPPPDGGPMKIIMPLRLYPSP